MSQQIYRTSLPVARAGWVENNGDDVTLVNDAPRTQQVDTIVVATATHSHEYIVEIDGVLVSYTADSSTGKAEISAGLTAAINAEPLLNGRLTAVDDLTDTVTITARYGGTGFVLTTDDAKLTLATTTANDEADPLDFGVPVIRGSSDTRCRLVDSAALTAKVITVTPVHINDATYSLSVTVRGVTYTAQTTADGSATVKEICDAITPILNAQLPANTVLVADDDTAWTLTAEIAGLDFQVAAGSDNASATMTVVETTATMLTDVHSALVGITKFSDLVGMTTAGVAQFPGGSAVPVRRNGRIVVATEESMTSASDVWLGVTGADKGKFRGSVGSTAANWIKLDRRVCRVHRNLSSSLAELSFRFGA